MRSAPAGACGRCGDALLAVLEGLCPRCLLSAALEAPKALPEESFPRRFGKYELLERIARGGMGEVFKAHDLESGRTVALKMIAGADLESEAQGHALKVEARIAARLGDHPNIVPVYDMGEHAERYYFAMKLMVKGSLADALEHYQDLHPWEIARLVEAIARAVYHGHQHGILHRDLKPANVLLDADGTPHVSDFGIAKAMDTHAEETQPDWGVGTWGYMAPEQVRPSGKPLTVAADVYSLGVILYELLTRQRPFMADSTQELREQVLNVPARFPREFQEHIPRDLAAICLKCLQKDPGQRYRSAAQLADELRRYRQFQPVLARPRHVPGRIWLWSLRHRLGAAMLVTLLGGLVGGGLIWRASGEDLRGDALRINAYLASHVARSILLELEHYSHSVALAAQAPALGAALQTGDAAALKALCDTHRTDDEGSREGPKPWGDCFLLDTTGRLVTWSPQDPARPIGGKDYGWRDYFQGARQLALARTRDAYVSRAFQAEADGRHVFAVSAPVYAADGTWVGVLALSVPTDSTLGALRLDDSRDSHRTATLVGLTDRSREQVSPPGGDVYTVLVHGRLLRGRPATLDPQMGRRIQEVLQEPSNPGQSQFQRADLGGQGLEGYRDPVLNEPGLAAVAPVGHTRFAVIVQTSESAVLQVYQHLALSAARWLVSFSVGVGLLWLVLWWLRERSLPRPGHRGAR